MDLRFLQQNAYPFRHQLHAARTIRKPYIFIQLGTGTLTTKRGTYHSPPASPPASPPLTPPASPPACA